MLSPHASTARSREFGVGIRAAIKHADFNGREIAALLGWDASKISNLMHGKVSASSTDLALLLGVCRVEPAERDRLLALADSMFADSWWQRHESTAPARVVVDHLAIAKTVVSWQNQVVPLFLQIPEYARAVMAASAHVSAGEVETCLQTLTELREDPRWIDIACTYYVHESALRLPVGGTEVHGEQIHHVLRMAVRPKVEIRVVPAALGAHAGASGPFTQLTFETYAPLIYVEGENSTLIIEGDASQDYRSTIRALDESSLDEWQSKALLARIGEELSAGDR
ncbi:helix-turn-helix transcriptional regulator [Lentzea sp. NPDC042327]|uniref:helix-turn-helix transcriptional regulator n=1 Tax=Lentzea sp. NPDC042327 TaxID=3154801 RepID=UPI0033D45A05